MRLIDADALVVEMCKWLSNENEQRELVDVDDITGCVIDEVNAQPTAYDLEKVCEELEKYRRLCFLTMANTGDEQLDVVYDYVSTTIEEVIDIVKRGGVDE